MVGIIVAVSLGGGYASYDLSGGCAVGVFAGICVVASPGSSGALACWGSAKSVAPTVV